MAALAAGSSWEEFSAWKIKYNKVFEGPEEDLKRFQVFQANMKKAEGLNKKSTSGAQFGPTKFAHMTHEEFKKLNGYRKPAEKSKFFKKKQYPKTPFKVSSIDWRDLGGVTPVKDQGQCGSCWAFSATQAIETGYFKSNGSLKILAPQQIVSCDNSDYGCMGGNTEPAYEYVEQAGGLEEEADYPYKSGMSGEDGRCKADRSEFAVAVSGYHTVSSDGLNEDDMYREIQETPMSICVDAESWQLYMGGVVDSSTCGTQLDHCVMVVGLKAGKYWTVKNSWAADWGEDGYIRVATGENACGVAEDTTYVDADTVAKNDVWV
jgi:cathepsin F